MKQYRIEVLKMKAVEIAYLEAIDKERAKTAFYIPQTYTSYGGSFYPTPRYHQLYNGLKRYRELNGL